ncbi:MAG: GGDEF domain-containing protein [Treponema sp.]|nr:GGDEF domain-containing protein [Treponema sp.]
MKNHNLANHTHHYRFLKILKKRSKYDLQTNLPNREQGIACFSKLLNEVPAFSLIKIRIINLKTINNHYGYECGDAVLRTVADQLDILQKTGTFFPYRASSAEFNIYYTQGHLSEESSEIQVLRDLLSIPFVQENINFKIRTIIGIVNSYDGLHDIKEFEIHANIALSVAERHGKRGYAFFTEDMRKMLQKEQAVVTLLNSYYSTNSNLYKIVYQPQICMNENKICGYEALVRIANTAISPADFIPIAETHGFIIDIGRKIIELVVKQLAYWKELGQTLVPISVNYSPAQITDENYLTYIKDLLKKYNIEPQYIKIEITEGLFIENENQVMKMLNDFKTAGIQLSLDDFGTGYASLNYLTYLPINTVKLDKSLIDTYLYPGKESFIFNLISLLHGLGMAVVAEGVEHLWQMQLLNKQKCDSVQGYYISKPLEAEAVMPWQHQYMAVATNRHFF